MKSKYAGLLVLFLIVSPAFLAPVWSAAAQRGVRPCLTSDLIGAWDLRNINSKIKIDANDSFGWPYQRFAFDIRGDVKEMMSTTPIAGDPAAVKRFKNAASTSKFSVDEKGILSISKIESPLPERCACSVAIKDLPANILAKLPEAKQAQVPHEGDLVLTYMNRNGQPVVIKSLRKVREV